MSLPNTKLPFALRLLEWFCPPSLYESIEGDLLEQFEIDAVEFGEKKAKRKLFWNVIGFCRPGILLRNKFSIEVNQMSMILNQLKFSIRILGKNKGFALVSAVGLSVSLAVCILVSEYVHFELSYDTFFDRHESIYRLQHNRFVKGELLYKKAMTFPEIGLAMKDYFPEIEEVARLFPISTNIEPVFAAITPAGERKSFSEPQAYLADSTFARVFDLDFIHGSSRTALAGANKIVLSKSAALRYFGKTDAVGETLHGNGDLGDFLVNGVFNDVPTNSHLKFDVLLSWFNVYEERHRFTWDGFYNYFLLKDGVQIGQIEKRLPDFAQTYLCDYYKNNPGSNSQFELQPLTTIHLDSHLNGEMAANGNRIIVFALLIIAGFIIFIAVVNQVNLTMARSLERVKEVGIRKIIGSTKMQLSNQFLVESLLLNLSSVMIGLLLAWLSYPLFNNFFDAHVSLSILKYSIFWIGLAAFIMLGSVLSGFYPAFILARLKVFDALKGMFVNKRKSSFQTALVTFQFSISLVLIIGTYVLFKQISFMQTKDLGFGIDHKLVVKILPNVAEEIDTTFIQKLEAVKYELEARSISMFSTVSSSIPGRENEWRGSTRLSGAPDDQVIRANLSRIDENFIAAFDLTLMAGRNYSSSINNEKAVLINAEAARQLGFTRPEEAIGKKVAMFGEREVIGVINSFHETGLHELVSPSMFITGAGYMKFLTLSLPKDDVAIRLQEIESIWKNHFPDKPFQYFFLNDYFNKQYQADILMSRSVSLLSGIAIMIACLGLFSLSIHTIHRKTKEIGIRKIVGASTLNIISELCRKFMTPIGLSVFIGIPISYYLINWWLGQYAYRIKVSSSLFFIPVIALSFIGFATILFQSLVVARKNPVDSLKQE